MTPTVWWLVLFAWSGGGTAVMPIPYNTEQSCLDAAKSTDEATFKSICVAQPKSDVSAWLRSYGGGNAVGY